MTLPMALTCSRLVLAPTVLVVWVTALLPAHDLAAADPTGWRAGAEPVGALLAILCCTVAIEVTDVLDGFLARRWSQVSDAGKFLDPLADNISRSTVFLCFLASGYVPVWMVALVFYRESVISGLRMAGATQNVVIAARWSGKTKAIVQGIVINCAVGLDLARAYGAYPEAFAPFAELIWWAMATVTAVTVLSSVDYFRGNRWVIAALGSSQPPTGPQSPPTGG